MSTEQVPLLNIPEGSSQDKLPTYSESVGHIVLSVNMPHPPPYSGHVNPTNATQTGQYDSGGNREYPAIQLFAFGICMLVGVVILYGFKHGF